MPDEKASPPSVPVLFLDNPNAPEVYASALSGASFESAVNVALTFESLRRSHDEKGTVNRVVNARLIMPVSSAIQMVAFLQDFLSNAQLNATQKPPEQPLQ